MSANGLKGAEAGKALGDAIAASVLKELVISGDEYSEYGSQKCDVEFVQTFSVGLRDNRALSKLDVRKNNINAKGKSALKKAAGAGRWICRSRCVHLESLLSNSSLQHHLLLPHCACRIKLLL
jgi:hypothetical protein